MKRIDSDTKVLIVGLGLIGGSYAKALTKKGCKVRAITLKDSDIEYSVKNGCVCNGVAFTVIKILRYIGNGNDGGLVLQNNVQRRSSQAHRRKNVDTDRGVSHHHIP